MRVDCGFVARHVVAVDLDGTVARLHRVEAAVNDVERRVERAVGAIRDVLDRAESNGVA